MVFKSKNSKAYMFLKFLSFAGLIIIFSLVPCAGDIIALENNYNNSDKPDIIICLDPGHGGKDTGATGPAGLVEKDVNLDISVRVKSKLNNAGYEVIMTRSDDSYLTDEERRDIANKNHADILISIHCNEFDIAEIGGSETFYCNESPAISRNLAYMIQNRLTGELSSVDRGTKTANFYILSSTHTISALVKGLFITNPQEEEKLEDRTFRDKIASAIASGIIDFMDSFDLAPFKAGIDDSGNTPSSIKPGESSTVELTISNNSESFTWPSSGANMISVSYHLYNNYGDIIVFDATRASLEENLRPGASMVVPITIKAPELEGSYIIEYDLVQEGVAWFSSRGNPTLIKNITVSSSAPENGGQQQSDILQSDSENMPEDNNQTETDLQNEEDNDDSEDSDNQENSIDYNQDESDDQESSDTSESDGDSVSNETDNYSDKKVIFVSDRDGGDYDLYISNLDGSSLKQLTENSVDELYPTVSPDGKKIAFTSTVSGLWQIMIMDRDGSNLQQITSANTLNAYPAWSNNGKYIFYESKVGNDWEIYRINTDGSDNKRLTYNPSGDDWHPSCHSSQELVFFETGPPGKENIMAMDYNGDSKRYITNDSARNRTPDVSAQNQTVVFTRYDNTEGQIFFMDLNGGNLRQVTSLGGRNIHPSFSPDGEYVGFDSDGDSKLQIYIFSVNDGSIQKLINDGSNNYKDPFFLFY